GALQSVANAPHDGAIWIGALRQGQRTTARAACSLQRYRARHALGASFWSMSGVIDLPRPAGWENRVHAYRMIGAPIRVRAHPAQHVPICWRAFMVINGRD